MRKLLQQQITEAISLANIASKVVDNLVEQYVRTVLNCPEGEIVVETPRTGRRFLVDKFERPSENFSVYISGQMIKDDGSIGPQNIGTFVDSPWFECCLSNRLPRGAL